MFSLDDDQRRLAEIHFRARKGFAWSEDFFLACLEAGAPPHDARWAILALRECGTLRSVPALKALAVHPTLDVRNGALLTLAQIAGGAETPYFVEHLLDPKGRSKAYALWAIGAVGDARALPAVVEYVRKNRKKLAADTDDPREQQDVLVFLQRLHETALLREFAFLAPPLRALSPHQRKVLLARAPGLEEVIALPGGGPDVSP